MIRRDPRRRRRLPFRRRSRLFDPKTARVTAARLHRRADRRLPHLVAHVDPVVLRGRERALVPARHVRGRSRQGVTHLPRLPLDPHASGHLPVARQDTCPGARPRARRHGAGRRSGRDRRRLLPVRLRLGGHRGKRDRGRPRDGPRRVGLEGHGRPALRLCEGQDSRRRAAGTAGTATTTPRRSTRRTSSSRAFCRASAPSRGRRGSSSCRSRTARRVTAIPTRRSGSATSESRSA